MLFGAGVRASRGAEGGEAAPDGEVVDNDEARHLPAGADGGNVALNVSDALGRTVRTPPPATSSMIQHEERKGTGRFPNPKTHWNWNSSKHPLERASRDLRTEYCFVQLNFFC